MGLNEGSAALTLGHVRNAIDGVEIGVHVSPERGPEGQLLPPVVLIHGATDDHRAMLPLVPLLSGQFQLFLMDRRGRGASGDADAYSLDLEFEDVAQVIDLAGKAGPDARQDLCPLLWRRLRHGRRREVNCPRSPCGVPLAVYEPPIPTSAADAYPKISSPRLRRPLPGGTAGPRSSLFLRGSFKPPIVFWRACPPGQIGRCGCLRPKPCPGK